MNEAQDKSIGIILTIPFSYFNIARTNFQPACSLFQKLSFLLGRHDNSLSDSHEMNSLNSFRSRESKTILKNFDN